MSAHPTPRPEPTDGLTRVGIRDLRHNLSDFVKRASAGERIIVTDRGTEIAELVPRPVKPLGIIEQGILDGTIIAPAYWPGPPPPLPEPLPAVAAGQPTLSEILRQMRNEDPR